MPAFKASLLTAARLMMDGTAMTALAGLFVGSLSTHGAVSIADWHPWMERLPQKSARKDDWSDVGEPVASISDVPF